MLHRPSGLFVTVSTSFECSITCRLNTDKCHMCYIVNRSYGTAEIKANFELNQAAHSELVVPKQSAEKHDISAMC